MAGGCCAGGVHGCCAGWCHATWLLGYSFDRAWTLVCELCPLKVVWVDCGCFLSFGFLGGASRLELSPFHTIIMPTAKPDAASSPQTRHMHAGMCLHVPGHQEDSRTVPTLTNRIVGLEYGLVSWGCTASCGWNVRCVGVRGDAWSVMLSPCNTHKASQPAEGVIAVSA